MGVLLHSCELQPPLLLRLCWLRGMGTPLLSSRRRQFEPHGGVQVQAEHARNPAACPLPASAFIHIEGTFFCQPHSSGSEDLSKAVRSFCR